ncbi:MAG: DNA/RNA nuclease SfsA [Actinobacteria bacterium]|nr:DNA/RNA nuclease SfsA [Actinomycetota bacterium]MDI6830544.1 DNA/RNA nuclease SfsA [Actinomycetota bacterium]
MDIGEFVEARFLERPNRFLALVERDGRREEAHVPDPGRLSELLLPGARVRLRRSAGKGRRTAWDMIGVECPQGWVNIDSRLPNLLFAEALKEGRLAEFPPPCELHPEYPFGASRLDFLVECGGPPCLVEVKGCTLVVEGTALFPDAPTARGSRHLEELSGSLSRGYRACVVLVVKHPGGEVFRPNHETDPLFASTLRRAAAAGVEVLAYLAPWRGREISIERRLPVIT